MLKKLNFFAKKYSFVVIGPGKMSERHAKLFLSLGYKLKAVYSPKKIKNNFFSDFNYLNNLDLLKNINFDFAIIASPNKYHSEQINFILEQNKIIFIEKPLVTNLIDLDLNNQRLLKNTFVSFNLRYQKNSEYFKNLIDKKKICKIEISWCRDQNLDLNSWYLNKTISGGGVFLDWGVHCLDLILFLLNFKNISFHNIKVLNYINNLECAIKAYLKIDNISLFLNLSWVEKKKQCPLIVNIYLDDGTKYIWHKSGEIFFYDGKNKKKIYMNNNNKMYEYFIKEYLFKKNIYKISQEKLKNFKIYFNVQKIIAEAYNQLNLK